MRSRLRSRSLTLWLVVASAAPWRAGRQRRARNRRRFAGVVRAGGTGTQRACAGAACRSHRRVRPRVSGGMAIRTSSSSWGECQRAAGARRRCDPKLPKLSRAGLRGAPTTGALKSSSRSFQSGGKPRPVTAAGWPRLFEAPPTTPPAAADGTANLAGCAGCSSPGFGDGQVERGVLTAGRRFDGGGDAAATPGPPLLAAGFRGRWRRRRSCWPVPRPGGVGGERPVRLASSVRAGRPLQGCDAGSTSDSQGPRPPCQHSMGADRRRGGGSRRHHLR